jgi:hypothetical protein
MTYIHWHDFILATSLLAAVIGVGLLLSNQLLSDQPSLLISDQEATHQTLLRMIFIYWIVYCLAVGLQKLDLLQSQGWIFSLKLTAILAYFLTFSSLLCLPLHHFEARKQLQ